MTDKNKNNLNDCESLFDDSFEYEFYRVFFDPVRTELFKYLSVYGAKNISEIAENFEQDRSVISRHLDLMYRSNILIKTKKSRFIVYDVNVSFVTEKFDLTANKVKKYLSYCEV